MKSCCFALCVFISVFCGCSKKPVLHVYTWAEYISPDVISRFEDREGCSVVMDTFDDNEQMLAKLLSGAAGYDVIFPTSYVIGKMAGAGLIERIDIEQMPNVSANFDNKYGRFLLSDGMAWSIPYAFSMTGVAYRRDIAQNQRCRSWWSLTNECFSGRVCILDDMREMLGIGLKLNGKSVNSTNSADIAHASSNVMSLKRAARRMDSVSYRAGLVSRELYAAIGYNSDIFQVNAEHPDMQIQFFIPDEGSTCCFDEMVIVKGGNTRLAAKFVDFMYVRENAQSNYDYILTSVPVKGVKQVDVPEDCLRKLELIRDVGTALEQYNSAWDRIKKSCRSNAK